MLTPDSFQTRTLANHPQGLLIRQILNAAITSVDPGGAVRNHLQRSGDWLHAEGFSRRLSDFERILLISVGKAAMPMAESVAALVGDKLHAGVVVTKHGHAAGFNLTKRIRVFEAGHPVPDEAGIRGTHHVIDLLRGVSARDLVICLISGGGSALLVAPAPGINLPGLQALTARLLASGADIHEINTIRKHLSLVKGGQLARLAYPAEVLTLILSDVVGDALDIIASGPTVPDPGHFTDAVDLLRKYEVELPQRIVEGAAGQHADTPKPGDPIFERVTNLLIGTNKIAAGAARLEAARLGFNTQILTTTLTGEAAWRAAEIAQNAFVLPPKTVLIAGGETTVTLTGSGGQNQEAALSPAPGLGGQNQEAALSPAPGLGGQNQEAALSPAPGLGGRNQEAALAAVAILAGHPTALFVTLATDGGDGPTDAAGAVVSGSTREKAEAIGLDPHNFLLRHDAYRFFDALGDLLKTGPTQTNVNDLWLLLI